MNKSKQSTNFILGYVLHAAYTVAKDTFISTVVRQSCQKGIFAMVAKWSFTSAFKPRIPIFPLCLPQ